MTRRNYAVLLVAFIAVFACCTKSARPNEASQRAGAQNSNEESTPRAAYAQQTARGDIERTAMAVDGALESARRKNLQQAIDDLEAAAQHIAKATTAGRPDESNAARFQVQIDEIKASIEAALNSARSGASDTASRIELIRTQINGLKVRLGT